MTDPTTTAEREEIARLIEEAVGSFGYQGHMAVHLTGAQLAVIVAALRDTAPASGVTEDEARDMVEELLQASHDYEILNHPSYRDELRRQKDRIVAALIRGEGK